MFDPKTIFASGSDVSVSLLDLLRSLHIQRRLQPLLFHVAAEKLVLHAAAGAGLTVQDEELQQAADHFRSRHGLGGPKQTQQWLARECLTADDFEAGLARDLLLHKFKRHLARTQLAEHFASYRDHYARAHLRQLVAPSLGLANELLAQIADEGRDFAELARQHSLPVPSAVPRGEPESLLRCQMPAVLGDLVFAARPGAVVGPIQDAHGFHLFLVEQLRPAELDEATADFIRQELFDAWLRQRLAQVRIDLSQLGGDDDRA